MSAEEQAVEQLLREGFRDGLRFAAQAVTSWAHKEPSLVRAAASLHAMADGLKPSLSPTAEMEQE